tara:strand:+ start:3505 stop:3615 length:111 start_codon:yes stop_codon:yes gene_type:complete
MTIEETSIGECFTDDIDIKINGYFEGEYMLPEAIED